jgi:alginate O-acetyltransferase complex protein AlgI
MEKILNVLGFIFSYDSNNPIAFISAYFLFSITVLILIYSFISKKIELRKWLLIIFNCFFFYKLGGVLAFVILIPTIFDFFIAKKIAATELESRKSLLLYLSIFLSLGLLIYFKYSNFLIGIFGTVTGTSFPLLKILIPVGISFYIFRSISYILDVYNEKIDPLVKFSDYLLYMTFFPLLIAGPITRVETFADQINDENIVNKEKTDEGLFLIFKGIIKKAIFADYLGLYVNMIFNAPEGYTGLENLVGITCFTVQLYLDFSGYTDIARGIAKVLGFEIGINFNEPLKANSVTDFWRRWHISLSEWLKDYIYFPLNFYFRKLRTLGAILAMFITFFICGIWHGTTFSFILFGILHGTALSWEIFMRNTFTDKKSTINKFSTYASWPLTFIFIIITMIAMRTENLNAAAGIVTRIFTNMDLSYGILFFTVQTIFTIMFILALTLIFLSRNIKDLISRYFIKAPLILKSLLFIVAIQVIIELQNQHIVPFIYAKY